MSRSLDGSDRGVNKLRPSVFEEIMGLEEGKVVSISANNIFCLCPVVVTRELVARELWKGRRTYVVDGSTVTMPDTGAN